MKRESDARMDWGGLFYLFYALHSFQTLSPPQPTNYLLSGHPPSSMMQQMLEEGTSGNFDRFAKCVRRSVKQQLHRIRMIDCVREKVNLAWHA